MVDIVTIGSGTMDVFIETASKKIRTIEGHEDVCYHVGGKQLINSLTTSTGGGGTNTAVAFSRLGLKTGWLGVVGNDAHGDHILDGLKSEKVTFFGKQVKGQSGYSVIMVGLHHDRSILTYKGLNNSLSSLPSSVKNARSYYFSSMMGKSFDTSKKLVKHAKKKQIPWAFNPSSYLAKKGMNYLKEFIDGCKLLICNLEEANMLCKTKNKSEEELISLIFQKNPLLENIVITNGAKGAVGCDRNQIYYLTAKKDKVIDVTGAGDSFAVGTFCRRIKGSFGDLGQSMKYGYALSTSVIGDIGAKKGLLSYKKLTLRVSKQKISVKSKPWIQASKKEIKKMKKLFFSK